MKKFSRIPLAFSVDDAWRYVIVHELCQTLGIPSSNTHAWEEHHCTQPACVIYPRYRWYCVPWSCCLAAFRCGTLVTDAAYSSAADEIICTGSAVGAHGPRFA